MRHLRRFYTGHAQFPCWEDLEGLPEEGPANLHLIWASRRRARDFEFGLKVSNGLPDARSGHRNICVLGEDIQDRTNVHESPSILRHQDPMSRRGRPSIPAEILGVALTLPAGTTTSTRVLRLLCLCQEPFHREAKFLSAASVRWLSLGH